MRYRPLVDAWFELELLVALYSSSSKVELARYFSSFSFLVGESEFSLGKESVTLRMKIWPTFPYFLLFLQILMDKYIAKSALFPIEVVSSIFLLNLNLDTFLALLEYFKRARPRIIFIERKFTKDP